MIEYDHIEFGVGDVASDNCTDAFPIILDGTTIMMKECRSDNYSYTQKLLYEQATTWAMEISLPSKCLDPPSIYNTYSIPQAEDGTVTNDITNLQSDDFETWRTQFFADYNGLR